MAQPIIATIRLRNQGQQTCGYTAAQAAYAIGLTLVGPDRKPVRRKSPYQGGFFGEELDRSGSYRWIRLLPREELTFERRLDDHFILEPGEYTVSLWHVLCDNKWTNQFRLSSGSVQIHLVK
jgi:hypothetical protein